MYFIDQTVGDGHSDLRERPVQVNVEVLTCLTWNRVVRKGTSLFARLYKSVRRAFENV